MSNDDILDRLCNVIEESSANDFDRTTVTDATTLESFGFDSLNVIDLLFDLEQEFGTQVPAQAIVEMKTVGDLVAYLRKHVA